LKGCHEEINGKFGVGVKERDQKDDMDISKIVKVTGKLELMTKTDKSE